MSNYDEHYTAEPALFGEPYPEFEALVDSLGVSGTALDLGCGQGRDALMLARYGLSVTSVDASAVGIKQLMERATLLGVSTKGVVDDFYTFPLDRNYDLVVLDSILHFAEDKEKELELLTRISSHVNSNGFVFIFIHKSKQKERALHTAFSTTFTGWHLVKDGYIDYVYEEKASGFRSEFQFYMFIIQRRS
ncbi:class I SAM-dependent methyltransferase [Chitinimonas sp. PSY-7]|uniref:methyltransferase domain-containing protein n=1 Tax=Chitinimonas sp. PSY-7 TaxID=3459088 RepID=UPI0040403C73